MANEESARPQSTLVPYNPMADAAAVQKQVEETATALNESTTFVDSLRGKSLDQLTTMAAEERQETLGHVRKAAIHAFRLGAVLHRIKAKQKQAKNWSQWLIANDWNQGTALRYVNLFEAVKNENRIKDMMIGEAEMKFVKTVKSKTVKKKEPPVPSPAPLSKTEQAREAISSGFALLRELTRDDVDKEALSQAKELAQKVLERIAELETV